ncbi:MAG: multidrug RND transporter, partial [Candidatus Nanopelagicus sp.]
MFEKLGSLIVKRKRLIFSLFLVAIFSAGAIGTSVFGKLDSGGYNDPKSDSAKAFEYLTDVFKVKDPAVVLVVETSNGVNDPAVVATAAKLEQSIKG